LPNYQTGVIITYYILKCGMWVLGFLGVAHRVGGKVNPSGLISIPVAPET
jgi:hypothetical protein